MLSLLEVVLVLGIVLSSCIFRSVLRLQRSLHSAACRRGVATAPRGLRVLRHVNVVTPKPPAPLVKGRSGCRASGCASKSYALTHLIHQRQIATTIRLSDKRASRPEGRSFRFDIRHLADFPGWAHGSILLLWCLLSYCT